MCMSPLFNFSIHFNHDTHFPRSALQKPIQVAPLMCPCWQSTMAFLRLWPPTVIPTWEVGDVWRWNGWTIKKKLWDEEGQNPSLNCGSGCFLVFSGHGVCLLLDMFVVYCHSFYFRCASYMFHLSASQLTCAIKPSISQLLSSTPTNLHYLMAQHTEMCSWW